VTLTIEHEDAVIEVEEKGPETRRVAVRMRDPNAYSPRLLVDTRYPLDLIRAVLQLKGQRTFAMKLPATKSRHMSRVIL